MRSFAPRGFPQIPWLLWHIFNAVLMLCLTHTHETVNCCRFQKDAKSHVILISNEPLMSPLGKVGNFGAHLTPVLLSSALSRRLTTIELDLCYNLCMKKILLTQGKFALVDDEDYKKLNQYKWRALKIGNTYYAARSTRVVVFMHRQILGLVPGDGKTTDHKNRNGLDNRRENLHIVSQLENCHNQGKNPYNTSGHKGVYWNKEEKNWHARIVANNKQIHLGRHSDIKDAIKARRQGELAYW